MSSRGIQPIGSSRTHSSVRCSSRQPQSLGTVGTVIASRNPTIPLFEAMLCHARGLVTQNTDDLVAAARSMANGPRLLSRASAAEDAGVAMARPEQTTEAVEFLDAALRDYVIAGATRDEQRVRARLRAVGVRRRVRRPEVPVRPATGWESLTVAERRVADLAITGSTNRQIADQLFLSPYTVATHMKHVFDKLSVNSRVEMARLAPTSPRAE